jgi:hypothetical protein
MDALLSLELIAPVNRNRPKQVLQFFFHDAFVGKSQAASLRSA